MGKCSKETTCEILDFFYTSGGNFVDTASNYQDEQSERWIGEWMATRKNRDQMVISTKFGTNYKNHYKTSYHVYRYSLCACKNPSPVVTYNANGNTEVVGLCHHA
jgi:aryl-alcohol dehydrogenase-like predicted oxidoreductase